MVEVQRLTGARPGEICAMRAGDIDCAGTVWVYAPASHKTAHHGHKRIICIGPRAQEIIKPFLLNLDPTAHVFRPVEAVAEMRQRRAESRKTPLSCGNVAGSNRQRRPSP
jgi:integrase